MQEASAQWPLARSKTTSQNRRRFKPCCARQPDAERLVSAGVPDYRRSFGQELATSRRSTVESVRSGTLVMVRRSSRAQAAAAFECSGFFSTCPVLSFAHCSQHSHLRKIEFTKNFQVHKKNHSEVRKEFHRPEHPGRLGGDRTAQHPGGDLRRGACLRGDAGRPPRGGQGASERNDPEQEA